MNGHSILNQMDFSNIIGGPLDAAVKAQSASAAATVNFIQEVGFLPPDITEDNKKLKTLEGSYDKVQVDLTKKKKLYDNATNENSRAEAKKPYDEAQVAFSTAESNLIKHQKGMEGKMGDVRYVSFYYEIAGESQERGVLKVPLLTIVPVPYLSIRDLDIDFSAKITEAFESKRSTEYEEEGTRDRVDRLHLGIWSRTTHVRSTFSSKSSSSYGSKRETEYSMNVKVHAENIDMPSGLSRILGILEANIVSQVGGVSE